MHADGRHPITFLIFGASLRRHSLNDRLASLAASVVEEKGGTVDRARMSDFDCPSYDQDVEVEDGLPAGAQQLRERLVAADAFIVSAPEYNASMPGVLKNVIDWVSRARPQPLNGKQGLVMSASPSMGGGNRGLWALRVPFEHLGARIYPDMFSLAQAHEAFGTGGRIANEMLQSRFERTIECFMDFVEAAKHYPALKKQWVEFLGERTSGETEREETAEVQAA
jgi:chromate reductase